MRRFTWFRTWNSTLDEPRWRLVARMAGSPQHLVEAFVIRLDAFANTNTPRGSLEGFSIAALSAHWNLSNDEVLGRIYAALEHPDVGWIDQDFLVTFFERNPDVEDATNAARQSRHRAKLKARKRAQLGEGLDASSTVTRYGRYVPHRSDQIIKQVSGDDFEKSAGPGASGAPRGLSDVGAGGAVVQTDTGESGEGDVDPRLWLASEGKRIVIERLQVTATLADTRLERWLRDLEGSHAALAGIVRAADRQDYIGARFHNLIVDQVKRHVHTSDGQRSLPLPPATVRKAAGSD